MHNKPKSIKLIILGLLIPIALYTYTKIYHSKKYNILVDTLIYFFKDTNNNIEMDLMIGSSSILRLESNTFLKCGNWINRGLGASTLIDTKRYINHSPSRAIYSKILIYAGENDLANNQPVNAVFTNYKKLLSILKSKYREANIHILAIKPSPVRHELFSSFENLNKKLYIHSLNSEKVFFHSFKWPKQDNFISKYFTNDNIHLSSLGYIALTKEFNKTCTS